MQYRKRFSHALDGIHVVIEAAVGKTAEKEFLPIQPADLPRTEADVTDLVADIRSIPTTIIKTGIEKFIESYKSYHKVHVY